MRSLKRLLAYAIDYALAFFLLMPLLAQLVPETFVPFHDPSAAYLFGFASYGLSLLAPALVLGALTGLLGWTPGKLLLSLRVRGRADRRAMGLVRGVGRECIKVFAMLFFCLGLYAVYGLVEHGRPFYDDWLGSEVIDRAPWGLTETQRNFRRHMNM